MSAVQQELEKNAGFLMKAAFISMPAKNKKLVEDAVGKNKLFVAPFDVISLVANSGRVYSKVNIEDLKQMVN